MGGNLTRVGVARLRLDRAAAASPEFRELGYFDKVASESSTRKTSPSERPQTIRSVPPRPFGIGRRCPPRTGSANSWSRSGPSWPANFECRQSRLDVDQPFPELGLDSMMAMTVLRETQQLVGVDLSANKLFNHPTISSLAAYLAEMLAPQHVPEEDEADQTVRLARQRAGRVVRQCGIGFGR